MKRSELIDTRGQIVSERGVVSSGHIQEAEAGVWTLEQGGNAIDAIVAAAFVGFVVEPDSCGLGGSGHLALFLSDDEQFVSVDHNVRAPEAARAEMFELDAAQPPNYWGGPGVIARRNESGHLAVGVPGAVAGLCAAHQRWGRLPLALVLEPAIEAAEAGLPVSWRLVLSATRRLTEIQQAPHLASWLLRDGLPPRAADAFQPGDQLDAADLARTLREIAKHGAAGFYSGWVAEAIVREVEANGGILGAADLVGYRPKIFVESPAVYRGVRYTTCGDPVGYETLNILDCFPLGEYEAGSIEFHHLIAEALGHAFVDNMLYYGDPDVTESPVSGLASRAFGAHRAAMISPDHAAARPIAPGDPWPFEKERERHAMPVGPSTGGGHSTSHMAVADREGNLAALCTTLTTWFGSLVLVPGTGILLNNAMQDFDPRPRRANSIAPRKMPMFAVPTVVAARGGEGVFAAAGAGGYRITTAVVNTMVNVLDFAMPVQEAVSQPRVHCQGQETSVEHRIPKFVQEGLRALGHQVIVEPARPDLPAFARVGAVARDPEAGSLHAGSGPGWLTATAGV